MSVKNKVIIIYVLEISSRRLWIFLKKFYISLVNEKYGLLFVSLKQIF